MSFTHCSSCQHEFTLKDKDVPYADGGSMEVNHGGGKCRKCYIKDGHRECPCGALPFDSWKYCPNCGKEKTCVML